MRHIPVLLDEVLKSFDGLKINTFVDATLGAGGHGKAILENHPEIKIYIGIDQDESALRLAKSNLEPFIEKTRFVKGNFGILEEILKKEKVEKAEGFLFDIGVSSMQLDDPRRGFSFSKEGLLDMRMDQSRNLTADTVVNTFSEKELEKIFWEYGEERAAKKVAKAIVESRKEKRLSTTTALAALIEKVKGKGGKIHPATLSFQALRIYVNDELNVLKNAIGVAIDHLAVGGRIGVISFHSLEDRIVKDLFKEAAKKSHVNPYTKVEERPKIKILTKKPITASFKEKKNNPRSRSAKLRVGEKT